MEDERPQGSDYCWEQAARLLDKAKFALTPEHRQSLLQLARRWEQLALKAATAEQTQETLSNRLPANVPELDVYRTAKQLVRVHPKDADAQAARRSRRFYELGDMANFYLWERIARAAMELIRKTPRGKIIN